MIYAQNGQQINKKKNQKGKQVMQKKGGFSIIPTRRQKEILLSYHQLSKDEKLQRRTDQLKNYFSCMGEYKHNNEEYCDR